MAFAPRLQDWQSSIKCRVYMVPATRGVRRIGPILFVFSVLLSACDSTGPALSSNTSPPPDTLPGDSTPGQPPTDTVIPPPPDTTTPPDTTGPVVVVHVGIPFGPFALPSRLYGSEFSGAYRPPWAYDENVEDSIPGDVAKSLMGDLEAARRSSTRVLLNFTGPGQHFTDAAGFSMALWKQRVDRFRGIDFTSYIADGTIVGHFLMDEPNDASNWNGDRVSPAEVDEMARYSKEIWPTMAAIVRGWPAYLMGYQFQYLDAAWAQYSVRFGSINDFITSNVRDAKASGLALVIGLNVLNGGSPSSGIPGHSAGKFGMSATELRSWGGALLAEPDICAFYIWKYEPGYFSRPEIKEALSDLNKQAASHPERACRHGP